MLPEDTHRELNVWNSSLSDRSCFIEEVDEFRL